MTTTTRQRQHSGEPITVDVPQRVTTDSDDGPRGDGASRSGARRPRTDASLRDEPGDSASRPVLTYCDASPPRPSVDAPRTDRREDSGPGQRSPAPSGTGGPTRARQTDRRGGGPDGPRAPGGRGPADGSRPQPTRDRGERPAGDRGRGGPSDRHQRGGSATPPSGRSAAAPSPGEPQSRAISSARGPPATGSGQADERATVSERRSGGPGEPSARASDGSARASVQHADETAASGSNRTGRNGPDRGPNAALESVDGHTFAADRHREVTGLRRRLETRDRIEGERRGRR